MTIFSSIHALNPQKRLIQQAANVIRTGGVLVFPSDSGYSIGCRINEASAVKRIRAIRALDNTHQMTLMLPDLKELGLYVRISTPYYRLIKTILPGKYTFILPAAKDIPKMMAHPKRREIGIRVPENKIALALLTYLEEPLITSTLILPDALEPLSEPEAISDLLGAKVDMILDGGPTLYHPSTVVDLCGDKPVILRRGSGDPSLFE